VYEKLKAISPDLIVVWGSGMLQKRIIATAKKVINLHLGLCPFYRGAVANQYALLEGDFSKIGATIHYVNSHVDAGDIIKTISFSKFGTLEDSFKKLNDQAYAAYLKVAVDIVQHKKINFIPQDTSVGKNILLKEWNPEMRYKTAEKMVLWNI
jgi:methionyl-tRNA formyltransferase